MLAAAVCGLLGQDLVGNALSDGVSDQIADAYAGNLPAKKIVGDVARQLRHELWVE